MMHDDQDPDLTVEDLLIFLLAAFRLTVNFYKSISQSDEADQGTVEN